MQADRTESLKAGVTAAAALGIAFTGILGLHLIWPNLPTSGIWWLHGASALIAGFLFGITYRYIVRQDQNSHLKSGAVLAFGLVRGLAQINPASVTPHLSPSRLLLEVGCSGLIVMESIVLFAVAQLVLEQALSRGWVQPFRGL
jgi:hypothetical protein